MQTFLSWAYTINPGVNGLCLQQQLRAVGATHAQLGPSLLLVTLEINACPTHGRQSSAKGVQ